jgi:hypothetical protein
LPQKLLPLILKPPRLLKVGVGTKSKVPWKEVAPPNDLPQLNLGIMREIRRESARRT